MVIQRRKIDTAALGIPGPDAPLSYRAIAQMAPEFAG